MTPSDTDTDDSAWARFDSEAYFAQYYADPHPDDDFVVKLASEAVRDAAPSGPLRTIDVGTGPNLYPLFAALPRAASLTAWEYSERNLAWLKNEVSQDGMRPPWPHFWNIVCEAYGPDLPLPVEPIAVLRQKLTIRQGSIYDLPQRSWDLATMFFCADSITDVPEEFERACGSFARCVKSGGALIAAFLVKSQSYTVAGQRYPVTMLSEDSLIRTFSPLAMDVRTTKIGIVEEEVKSGYTGMVLLTARSI